MPDDEDRGPGPLVPQTQMACSPLEVPALRREWPSVWMPYFLLAIRETANVRIACESAGIDRMTSSRAREKYPEFAEAWLEMLEEAFDRLENYAWKRAMSGSKGGDEILWKLLQSYRRDQFGDQVKIQIRAFEREAQRLADEYDLDPDEMIALARQIVSDTKVGRQARGEST